MPHKDSIKTEVAIIGGGLVGLTTAHALASIGVKSIVIEARKFDDILNQADDGRSSAIAYGSYLFLKQINAWDALSQHAGPILDIRITDNNSPLFLHYDHTLVGDEPMGYMLPNNTMWQALYNKASKNSCITLKGGCRWKEINSDTASSHITLENNEEITANLLAACDGKFSKVRQCFGIQTRGWSYKQAGIVCNVKHEKDHRGIAQERFLPSGPFAILPLKGGYESSLVWTEKGHLAPYFTSMNEEDVTEEIQRRFGDYLGKITLSSPIQTYPLSLSNSESYIAQRMVLLGDAAHAIHPIAGQGFNLGIRDVEALLPLVAKEKSLGLDIANDDVLKRYADKRKFDTASLIAITDLLNRLFSNDVLPLKAARRVGLAAVDKLPKLKRFFMQHAMGMSSKTNS